MEMNKALFFLTHFLTFFKFYYLNWRFKKYGYRRFLYTLYTEQKEKQENEWVTTGFLEQVKIKIHADYRDSETLNSIPLPDWLPENHNQYRADQLPFILLQRNHRDIFEACTHLKRKEVI
jgi:hypothetical protein